MANVSTPPLALVMTCFLAACQTIPATRTSGTDAAVGRATAALVADTCRRAWRPITYSSRDTAQTQVEVRAGNAARAVYCGEQPK